MRKMHRFFVKHIGIPSETCFFLLLLFFSVVVVVVVVGVGVGVGVVGVGVGVVGVGVGVGVVVVVVVVVVVEVFLPAKNGVDGFVYCLFCFFLIIFVPRFDA